MSEGWPMVPLSQVLTQYQEYIDAPEPHAYTKLSVKLYGKGVVLDTPTDGSQLKMRRHQIAKAGQVILSEIWGKKGAIGFVPPDGDGALCTSHFFLFNVDYGKLAPGYLQAIFTANYLEEQLSSNAKGTTGYAAVRPKHLLASIIPLPPLSEQQRIVARIEELTGKIERVKYLRQQIRVDVRRTLTSEYARIVSGMPRMPMSEVAPVIRRPVEVEEDNLYSELGIRSFGKGTFQKLPASGIELGTKRIFRIEPGDLLFNIVFAWEGAVAIARPEDEGRVGSHRFLTCVVKPDMVLASFLWFHFLTNEGLDQLGKASPGGAGRNRTLGLKALNQIAVPVPPLEEQVRFDRLLKRFSSVESLQTQAGVEIDALMPSILDRVFRGKIA